jgi:hypothetical protein
MFGSMSINNRLFAKSRFWQSFPSDNRLKSHSEPRVIIAEDSYRLSRDQQPLQKELVGLQP